MLKFRHAICPIILMLSACNNNNHTPSRAPDDTTAPATTSNPTNATSPGTATSSNTKTIIFFGNSLTAGYGLNSDQSFPTLIGNRLDSLHLPWKVINAGISGDTSAGILSRIGSAVPEGTRIVILSVFAYNDNRKGISPAEHQANVAAIERQLRSRGIRIINANGLIQSALKAGMVQGDGIHLTAEGCRRVAMGLLGSVR